MLGLRLIHVCIRGHFLHCPHPSRLFPRHQANFIIIPVPKKNPNRIWINGSHKSPINAKVNQQKTHTINQCTLLSHILCLLPPQTNTTWWRHDAKSCPAYRVLLMGIRWSTVDSLQEGPAIRNFVALFFINLNKLLNTQSSWWWFVATIRPVASLSCCLKG